MSYFYISNFCFLIIFHTFVKLFLKSPILFLPDIYYTPLKIIYWITKILIQL